MIIITRQLLINRNYKYDAFGNALGNSIVQGIQSSQGEKRINQKLQAASEKATTPLERKQAIQQVYEQEGIVFDDSTFDDYVKGDKTFIRGQQTDDGIKFTRYKNGKINTLLENGVSYQDYNTVTNHAFTSRENLISAHEHLLNWAGSDLSTSSQLLGLSRNMYNSRSEYFSTENLNHRLDNAYQDGITRGIHNYNIGQSHRIANMQGFNANYMTDSDWQDIVVGQTQKWGRELKNDVMDIVAAPLMLTGFGYAGVRLMGAGALKLAQGAFRGSMIHGSSRLAATKTMLYGGAQIGAGDFLIDRGINFAQKSLTGSNNVINDMHRVGKQIYHEAKRNGGITQAVGFTFGGEAFGVRADFAFGGYYANNFHTGDVNFGPYLSGELGGNLTFPMGMPSWGAGFEATTLTSHDWETTMKDFYFIGGADIGKRSKALNLNYVRPEGTNISGYQASAQIWGSPNDRYSANGMSKIGWGWAW